MQRREVERLKPEYRLARARHGYALGVDGTSACRSALNARTEKPKVWAKLRRGGLRTFEPLAARSNTATKEAFCARLLPSEPTIDAGRLGRIHPDPLHHAIHQFWALTRRNAVSDNHSLIAL